MRVEILFLRWLLVIAVGAGIAIYLRAQWAEETEAPYQTIALVQGGKSSGMPLAGVAIDPDRGDVYAIVGGPRKAENGRAFGIIWKGPEGNLYATAGSSPKSIDTLFEIEPQGQLRSVHKLNAPQAAPTPELTGRMTFALQSMINSLPESPGIR